MERSGESCAAVRPAMADLVTVALEPQPAPADYRAAMALATGEAGARLGEHMLLSWYDRDRDFESPQHASECHRDSAVPGYLDYALHRGATLRVEVDGGRFVFLFMPLDFNEG